VAAPSLRSTLFPYTPLFRSLGLGALRPVIDHPAKVEILVIGCGAKFVLPDEDLRKGLREHGIVLEWMDTAAACRTYNVLAIEDRVVAAALVAVD